MAHSALISLARKRHDRQREADMAAWRASCDVAFVSSMARAIHGDDPDRWDDLLEAEIAEE